MSTPLILIPSISPSNSGHRAGVTPPFRRQRRSPGRPSTAAALSRYLNTISRPALAAYARQGFRTPRRGEIASHSAVRSGDFT